MITPENIRAAATRIAPYIRATPVLDIRGPGLGLDSPVTLKLELFQHVGNFKTRGAFNSLLSMDLPAAGVVAASGGNHGAAVAYASHRLEVPARIFVPEIAGETKIGLIRATGAALEVVPGAYADALEAAESYRDATGAISIHAYDAPATVAGQGTLGPEIEAQVAGIDVLMVAVGGGGLIAGLASWFANRIEVVGVEPVTAQALTAALRDGPDAEVEVSGIAANSLGARRIGRICYETAVRLGLKTVLVTDEDIHAAQVALWQGCRVAAEPGGAAALAALTSGAYTPPQGAKVGVLVCGGNFEPAPF